MMRRISIFLACLVSSLIVSAQDTDLLSAFRDRMAEGSVRMEYVWKMNSDGKDYSGSGSVVFQNNSYRLQSELFDVYDDGTSMWTVNRNSREVVGEMSASANVATDPLSVLALFGFDSKGADISLRKDADGNPSGLDVVLKNGSSATIEIAAISFEEKKTDDFFSFDPETLDSSYVVTDLR